jgi:hypothetical protein
MASVADQIGLEKDHGAPIEALAIMAIKMVSIGSQQAFPAAKAAC